MTEIRVTMHPRMPFVRDIAFEVSEVPSASGNVGAWTDELHLEIGGEVVPLVDFLLAGELASLDQPPAPTHEVLRTFDPPATLLRAGHPPLEGVRVVRATVGERDIEPTVLVVGGREQLAWLLRDTLGGTCVWFTTNGQHHVTSA